MRSHARWSTRATVAAARGWSVFYLITVLFLSGSPQGFHARQRETDLERQFIATIGRLKQSVAPIVCRGTSPSAAQATVTGIKGTGFFLAENGTFLTAAHVLRRLPSDATCQQPAIYLPTNNWATDQAEAPMRLFDFHVAACVSHEALDLGRCQTITDLRTAASLGIVARPVTLEPVPQEDGTQVAFTGFPLQNVQPLTSRGSIAAYQAIRQTPRAQMVIDKNAWPGAGGSPVYLRDGRVVGMLLQRGTEAAAGNAYARPAASIQRFLNSIRQ